MNCAICKKGKIIDNSIGLLSYKKNEICYKCEQKYKPGLFFTKIPINKHHIYHFYLYENSIPENAKQALSHHLRPLFLLSEYYKKTVIFLDDNFLLKEKEQFINLIDKCRFGDVIMLSYSPIDFI